jgi:hypothetical protein
VQSRRQSLRLSSSLPALLAAHTAESYRVRVPLVFWRIGKWVPVHLFAYGLFDYGAGTAATHRTAAGAGAVSYPVRATFLWNLVSIQRCE